MQKKWEIKRIEWPFNYVLPCSLLSRYTFGSALFVGWVAGGLAFVGGIMMCIACRGLAPEDTKWVLTLTDESILME